MKFLIILKILTFCFLFDCSSFFPPIYSLILPPLQSVSTKICELFRYRCCKLTIETLYHMLLSILLRTKNLFSAIGYIRLSKCQRCELWFPFQMPLQLCTHLDTILKHIDLTYELRVAFFRFEFTCKLQPSLFFCLGRPGSILPS